MLNDIINSPLNIFSRVFLLLLIGLLLSPHLLALSPEQLKIYQRGVYYYDVGCSPSSGTTADTAEVSGDLQELAQSMLKNNKISYWANAPEGADPNWKSRVPKGGNTSLIDTRDVVSALANGERAYTTAANAPNKYADLNPNILKFILEASKDGAIKVNALTDKTHSDSSSNHYKGLAVDLDLGTAIPVDKLNEVASKYGGKKNSESDHHHYDFLDRAKPKGTADASGSTATNGDIKSVYMRGDSITVGAIDGGDIVSKFKKSGIDATVTASGGGTVTRAGGTQLSASGDQLSGLSAIDKDKQKVSSADAVVVAYGTNNFASEMESEIKDMVNKIHSVNKDAAIFWVNIDTDSNAGLTLNGKKAYTSEAAKEKSKIIEEQSKKLHFTVIDMLSENLPLADGIHPTYDDKGIGKWSQTVVDAVSEGAATTEDSSTQCQCGGSSGSTALVGSDNAEKIFNYFVGQGLEPYMAAAFMGNMNSESGLDPTIIEGGSHGDYPIEGTGFGLVQWTFADRQDPLVALAKKEGVKPSDLGVQLDYVMQEIKGKFDYVYNDIKQAKNVEEATLVVETKYEVHAGGIQPQRTEDAKAYLAKYGSGSGAASSSSSGSTSCTSGSSGQVVGEYSLPVDKKIYDQHPDWFSQPHHDYAADDIPVPSGTKVYAMTAGKIISAPVGSNCGNGVMIAGDDKAEYLYCHGSDGGSVSGAKNGDTVKAGQLIMHSDNTGNTSGPHLHVEIRVNGQKRCPQSFIKSIAQGHPEDVKSLPSSGCSY